MIVPRCRPGTLHAALARHARAHPGRVALEAEDTRLTWEGLLWESLAMAEALQHAGVSAGEFVGTWGTSAAFQVIALCGAAMLEAVHTPLNPRWPPSFLREMGHKVSVVVSDGKLSLPSVLRGARVLSWSARGGSRPRSLDWEPRGTPQSPVTVDFTRARAEGSPRGALLTHAMVLANAQATGQVLGLGPKDSYALLFPSWQHPHESLGKALVWGCTCVAVDFPFPRTILGLLARHSPTWVIASPRVLEGVLPFGDRVTEAFQRVKGVLLVGDQARPLLVARLRAAGLEVLNGWGSAETSGVAIAGPLTPDSTDVIGTPCPGYEASIRSPAGAHQGELLVRGEGVSLFYLDHRPAAGPEGWFATGDVARMTKDGTLQLMGRPHEALGEGRRISLARLETSLAKVPGVADVAAVMTQEALAIYVEPTDRSFLVNPLVQRLRKFFPESLPDVFVVSCLPRTPDGRIDKEALARKEARAMSLESIDRAILSLLNQRAALMSASPRPEESPLAADELVLRRVVGSNTGPLFDDAVREIFQRILDHCRRR